LPFPDFAKQNVKNALAQLELILQKMIDNEGKVKGAKQLALLQGGGSGSSSGDEDNDKLTAQIMEAVVTEKPDVKWSDIAGLEVAKKALSEALTLPIRFPKFFENGTIKPWKVILLYGPPGTGKTLLAKACATEVDSIFFWESSLDLISKFLGESEKMISILYNTVRDQESAIIFLDEINYLYSVRSKGKSEGSKRLKTQFLVEMDGAG
jgi:vacuolar protein-sorting-associated protein 4